MDQEMIKKCSDDMKILKQRYISVTEDFIMENAKSYHAPISAVIISALFECLKETILVKLSMSCPKNVQKIVEGMILPNLNMVKTAGMATLKEVINRDLNQNINKLHLAD